MHRTRRSVKTAPIIEDSSESEDEVPVKKPRGTPKIRGKNKNKSTNHSSSSSESDIENYLQPIDKLDFSSSFFNTENKNETEFKNIEKGIFAGVTRLSESSDSDELEDGNETTKASLSVATSDETEAQPSTFTTDVNFQQLEDYTRRIEEAKKQVEKYNAKKTTENSLDIGHLLAAGESKQVTLENIKEEDLHSSDFESTDDEWEEVKVKEQTETKEKAAVPKDGIQITVGEMPDHCKKKKGVDLLAAMKRRLNRIRKENQVYVHKVHLLCWIAHGNYVNSILNNTELLGLGLSLLPSDKCYPSDRTDLGYLEQIVQWYKKTVILNEKTAPKELELVNLIKFQINKKQVLNKKMYVLIFVIILRALGIQCRLVMSLQVEPLRPPASDLHTLSKESDEKNPKGKKSTEPIMEKKSSNKKSEVKNNKMGNRLKKEDVKKHTISKSQDQHVPGTSKVINRNLNKNKDSNTKKTEKPIEKDKESSSNKTEKQSKKTTRNYSKVTGSVGPMPTETARSTRSSKTVSDIPKNKGEVKKDIKNNLTVTEEKKPRTKSNSEAPSEKNAGKKTRSLSSSDVGNPKKSTQRRVRKKDEVPQLDGMNDSNDDFSDVFNILQLDGANDKETKKRTSQKPNLQKLKLVVEKLQPNRKKVRAESDSESEFSPSPPKKLKKYAPNLSKLKSPVGITKQLDVRNDIINLIKGRIAEQKHVDRSKLARKSIKKSKTPIQDSDSDSDYMIDPIEKKHHDSDSDIDYFVPKPKVKRRINLKKDGTKIISSDSDLDAAGKKKKKGFNFWVEVYLESEEKWISADVTRGQVHCINEIFSRATHPVSYILAWNNDNTLKDVTRRYCKNFNTITRKLRVDEKWWEESLKPFRGKTTARDREEDDDLNRQQLDQPLPTAISEYKNHPLYALRRHLLKFEDIYPADIAPIGFVRKEAVYPRNCVYVCKSRDIWLKDARVVKPGEKPYKIVKARPKYDKLSNKMITDQLLEIFGPWQTMEYEPPTAQNGVVPRNAFGNVELFKPCMLPKGTVHLKLAGLNKVCRKLNIDCASAIVGFDFHGGWSHPTYDGFVVCEEFTDQVIAAWELEQDEIEKKENEKIEKRVYGNWRKLIKGLFIRERLKAKYDFGGESSSVPKDKKKTKKPRIQSDSESD